MTMRILLLALAALLSFGELALAQMPGQTNQPPDMTRRPRPKQVDQAPPAAEVAPADVRVIQVEQYLNSLRSLQGRFVQNNPNGSVVKGTLYLRKPGRMRFEYDAPSALKIIADGTEVIMWDVKTKDYGQWPIGWTAASFLVKEPLQLTGDLRVERIENVDGLLALTLTQARKPQEGKVIVRLSENPWQLRGWSILDARGNRVDVALTDLRAGVQLADSLFKFDGPDPSQMRREQQ
jgi:outer membrane lipoprotein-sorting protein